MSKLEPSNSEQQLIERILSFKYDPEGFVEYVFPWGVEGKPLQRVEGPRQWQRDDLRMVADHLQDDLELQRLGLPPRPLYMARSSGRGPGKSALVSMLNLWMASCWIGGTGIVTANTEAQLRTRTMAEIGKWHTLMINRHWFDKSTMALRPAPWFKELVETQLGIDTQYYYVEAQTWSEDNPDAFAGAHSQIAMMLTMDEACHDDRTEVLTEHGWRLFADLTGDERLLSMDPETHVPEYLKPVKIHRYHRQGDMYEYVAGKTGNFCVTPNHEMYFRTYNGKVDGKRGPWRKQQIRDMNKAYHHIPRHINWNVVDIDYFEIPEFKSDRKFYPSRRVSFDDWMVFLGWFVSEGSTIKRKWKCGDVCLGVDISQNPGENLNNIVDICESLGFNYSVYVLPSRNSCNVTIRDRALGEYLIRFGGSALTKRIPDCVRWGSRRQINLFLDTFVKGDGYSREKRDVLYTSSEVLAGDLQELCIKAGYGSVVRKRKLMGKPITFATHTAISSSDGYVITRSKFQNDLKFKHSNVTIVPYNGMVYCAEVPPHHLLFTRRDGHCIWSGNSGISDPIWNVSEGFFTDLAFLRLWVAFSNPRQVSGRFYDCFHRDRGFWNLKTIDSRTVEGIDHAVYQRIADKYGEDHDVTRVEVKGEFPKSGEDNVISLGLVEAAVNRDVEPSNSKLIWGLDVARFGMDRTVLAKRQGNTLLEKPLWWRGKDLMQTVGKITEMYRRLPEHQRPGWIVVDSIGIGAGVVDGLRQNDIPVKGVNVSEAPSVGDRFMRLRDDLYWRMREWFEGMDVKIPEGCDELIGELVMPRYEYRQNGKIKVETKVELKKRLGRSPDLSDALMLTFAVNDQKMTYNLPETHLEMFV